MARIHFSTKDILKKSFKNKMRGYDPTDVDSFLDMIIEDYRTFESTTNNMKDQINSLMRENRGLRSKLAAYQSNPNQARQVSSNNQMDANTTRPEETNIDRQSDIAGFNEELSRSPRYLNLVRRVKNLETRVFGN